MRPVLYLLTAVATALQAWFALTAGTWRPPAKWLEYVALLGAAVLFAAAIMADRNLRSSCSIAVAGLILLWSWYLPALFVTFYRILTDLPGSGRLARYQIPALIPTALLITTSVCVFREWRPPKRAP